MKIIIRNLTSSSSSWLLYRLPFYTSISSLLNLAWQITIKFYWNPCDINSPLPSVSVLWIPLGNKMSMLLYIQFGIIEFDLIPMLNAGWSHKVQCENRFSTLFVTSLNFHSNIVYLSITQSRLLFFHKFYFAFHIPLFPECFPLMSRMAFDAMMTHRSPLLFFYSFRSPQDCYWYMFEGIRERGMKIVYSEKTWKTLFFSRGRVIKHEYGLIGDCAGV